MLSVLDTGYLPQKNNRPLLWIRTAVPHPLRLPDMRHAFLRFQATKDVVQSFVSTFDFNANLPDAERTRVAAVGGSCVL